MAERTLNLGKEKNLSIPDHSEQLQKAEECIEKLQKRLRLLILQNTIDDETHTAMYDEVGTVLFYVGQLSQDIFDLQDDLEEDFKLKFLKSPELGKQLYWEEYERLHKPYSLLKNRCYRLFTELDVTYWNRFKKHPPNWKL